MSGKRNTLNPMQILVVSLTMLIFMTLKELFVLSESEFYFYQNKHNIYSLCVF